MKRMHVVAMAIAGMSVMAVSGITCPEIDFCLYMTTPATNAPERKVSSAQMKARTVTEREGKTLVEWRGHSECGDGFTVTAELTPTPEKDGWSYEFRYSGNESGLGIRLIDFPMLTVPRTDKTAIFYPKMCGQIRRPKWADVKPGANVAMAAACGVHFMAALNGTRTSWYVDQRGDARLRPNWSIVRNGKTPQTTTLVFRHGSVRSRATGSRRRRSTAAGRGSSRGRRPRLRVRRRRCATSPSGSGTGEAKRTRRCPWSASRS